MAGIAIAAFAIGAFASVLRSVGEAKMLKAKKRFLEQQAILVEQLGAFELRSHERASEFRRGQIAAGFGASGVRVDRGSPLEVLLEQSRADASTGFGIKLARDIEAFSLRTEARIAKFQRKQTLIQAPFDAVGTGLSAAGGVGGFGGGATTGTPSTGGEST